MTPDDLRILIQEGEGTTLEFKESLSSSFARELVALANTIGGKILLGVRDDGTVIGVHDSNTTIPHSGHRPQLRSTGEGASRASWRGVRGPRKGKRRQASTVQRWLFLAPGGGDPETKP